MLTSALAPIYAVGFYTSTSGGHSNFRLCTKYLLKRRPANPIPSLGEGKHSHLNLFPNHCAVLEGKISQKVETEIPQREGEKAFSWREHACEENAFSGGMKPRTERDCLRSPSEGFHSGSLQFSAGPLGGGFGTELNFQANYLSESRRNNVNPLQIIFFFYCTNPLLFFLKKLFY